jgi:hypothetical protein
MDSFRSGIKIVFGKKFLRSWTQLGFREDLSVRNWFGMSFKSDELAYAFVDWI